MSLFVVSACSGPQTPPEPEYAPVATIKDIMLGIVDPSADVVWNAVQTVVGPNGIEEVAPKNDEEWKNARYAAIRIIEATNLLIMPGRHVAKPGEKSEAPGVELEPAQMEELINKDRPGFMERAKKLHEVGVAFLAAIDAKDVPKVFDVGDDMEMACENCHSHYWYPNQKLPPGYNGEAVPDVPVTGVRTTP
jgi:hypothetical protein